MNKHISIEYIAGYLDCKGYFGIRYNKSWGGYDAKISLCQQDNDYVLNFIQKKYGGHIKKYKNMYYFYITDMPSIIKLLEQVVPLMMIKQRKAKELLDFCYERRRQKLER